LLPVVIAFQSIACEPPAEAFSEITRPRLSKEILLFALFIWMASASAAWRSASELFVTVSGQPSGVIADRAASAGLLDHAIVLNRRSAGDGDGDAAPTHLQITGRVDHARAAWESLCGGDGAGDRVRAGHELGSRGRRSEKSESDHREIPNVHGATFLGWRLRQRHSLTVTIVRQARRDWACEHGVNRNCRIVDPKSRPPSRGWRRWNAFHQVEDAASSLVSASNTKSSRAPITGPS
jgi:hypothetical protein